MRKELYLEKQSIGYGSWQGIKQRCRVNTTVNYPKYGGRGIVVCDDVYDSFEYFISIVGKRPTPKHSIDRIDNTGGYTCGICTHCIDNSWSENMRWATDSEQMLNRGNFNLVGVSKRKTEIRYNTKNKIDKGICKTRHGKYRARIWQNRKWRSYGAYSTIEEARLARDNILATIKSS